MDTVILSYSDIDVLIQKAITAGLQPVENPKTAALNAASAVGKIHALMFLYDHHITPAYIESLASLHDKYKNDIEKLLSIQEAIYG